MPDGTTTEDPQKISDLFNAQFASMFIAEESALPKTLTVQQRGGLLSHISVELNTIRSVMRSIKPLTYPGPDGIPPIALKYGGDDIALMLQNIFNLSSNSGIFPSQWKTSVVIPQHKSGTLDDMNNYRPINHTPIASRIFERVVKQGLWKYICDYELISPAQHGFISKRSCATCHLEYFELISSSLDSGLSTIVILLDMQKAFDRVPHRRLLCKLEAAGIRNPLLQWFSSFLEGRNQIVQVNKHFSAPLPVTSGVIQGSVLGPLLFLLYINDICNVLKHGHPFLFADDIKLVYTFHPGDLKQTLSYIKKDLKSLESWSDIWLIKFSPAKSHVLAFKCAIPTNAVSLHDVSIPVQSSVRDLGIRYSCSLNFSEQVEYQLARARQLIGLISSVFSLPQAKLEMYKIYVRPILEYGSIVGSNLRKCDRVALESLQRSFSKAITGYSTTLTYKERSILLSLEPLWLRRLKINLVFLHSILNDKTYATDINLNLQGSSTYSLRNKDFTVLVPRARTSKRERSFVVKYSTIWNRMPCEIRATASRFLFKSRLTKYFTAENVLSLFKISTTLDDLYECGPGYV
jgi:hypothetical protein